MNTVSGSGRELTIDQDDFLVSKSDLKGCLTYVNRTFMRMSGYPEYELLGQQHNIIRHPDMPRGIFHLLWQRLTSGRECYLYLKNLSREGDFYWAFTHVSIALDEDGRPRGYFSVGRRPSHRGVETITPMYEEMLRIEQRSDAKRAAELSSHWLLQQVAERGLSYEGFMHSLGY